MKILIKNPRVLTWEEGRFTVVENDVCIDGERIAAVGSIPQGFVPEKVIDGADKLVMPAELTADKASVN